MCTGERNGTAGAGETQLATAADSRASANCNRCVAGEREHGEKRVVHGLLHLHQKVRAMHNAELVIKVRH